MLGPNSFLTIAGQSAPGDGIHKNYDFGIVSAHDVIVRFLRVRQGSDALTPTTNPQVCNGLLLYGPTGGTGVSNVMIDHVSVEWSCDDSSGAWGWVTDTTIQWSLVAEGMTHNDFMMNDGAGNTGSNSKGMLIGGGSGSLSDPKAPTLSVHHNVIAHSGSRLPNISYAKLVDYRNNLVYDWQASRR